MSGEETTSPSRASESTSLPSRTASSPILKSATATDTNERLGDNGLVQSTPPQTLAEFRLWRHTYDPGEELGVQHARELPNIRPDPRPNRPHNPLTERGPQPRQVVLPTPRSYPDDPPYASQLRRVLPNTIPEPRPTHSSNLQYSDSYRPAIDGACHRGERWHPNTWSARRPSREAHRANSSWLESRRQTSRTLPNFIPDARPDPSTYRPTEQFCYQQPRRLPNITPEPRPSTRSQFVEQLETYRERARQFHYTSEQEMDDAMRHPKQNGKPTDSSGTGTCGSFVGGI